MRCPFIRIAKTNPLLEPAVYHAEVRENLILLDAHNGATSYSGISTLILKTSSASARMPIRDIRLDPKRVQRNTTFTFTNRVMLWKNKVNGGGPEIMFPWLDRTKNKAAKESANTTSGPQNHDEEADSLSDLTPTSSMDRYMMTVTARCTMHSALSRIKVTCLLVAI